VPVTKLNLPPIQKGATYKPRSIFWVGVDLTGCTARMQVRETVTSTVLLLDLTTANGRIIITPLTSKIQILVDVITTTALLTLGGVYDLEIVFPDTTVTRLVEGKLAFIDEVTR
jgi:hypothetical protein